MKMIALVMTLVMGLLAVGGPAPAAPSNGENGSCACSAHHLFGRGCQISGACPCVCHCPFIGGCSCRCGNGGFENPVGD